MVLEGEAVLVTDDGEEVLRAGDCAGFAAGEANGHHIQNRSDAEVVLLEAQLLGIEDLGDGYMASVEFSGMIREEPSAGPSPFREVWNMTKPKSGASGWLVAGLQALQ